MSSKMMTIGRSSSDIKITATKDDLFGQWFVEYFYKPCLGLPSRQLDGNFGWATFTYAEFRDSVSIASHMYKRFDSLYRKGMFRKVLTNEEIDEQLSQAVFG